MAQYTFTAERQLIFYVTVDGQTRLVQFGERSQWGASNFTTSDAKVAAAIRKHSMFKRGVISESAPAGDAAAKTPLKCTGDAAAKTPLKCTGGKAKEDGGDVIEVDNFTQARETVMKRLGIGKGSVKNPMQLQKVAKDNGIVIKYREK